MGNSNTNFGSDVSEDNLKLFQVSYADHTGYSDYVDQKLYNHVFNSDNLFPDLSEYTKLKIASYINQNDLSFSQEALATLKIVETGGSFRNVLGHYNAAADGTIRDVSIAFKNTRAAEIGLSHTFNINGKGESVNFFMIANGYALNKEFSNLDDDNGSFSFVYHAGEKDERLAQITDNADDITLIYQAGDGKISTIRGPVYHSTETESGSQINSDGDIHVISGLVDNSKNEVLRIGFEDFPGLGDADYNDVVFDLSVSYLNPAYNPDDKIADTLSNIEPAARSSSNDGEQGGINTNSAGMNGSVDDPVLPDVSPPLTGNVEDIIVAGEYSINVDDVISDSDHIDEYIAGYIDMNTSDIYGEELSSLPTEGSPIVYVIDNVIDFALDNTPSIEVII